MEINFLCEVCETTDEHKFARYRPNLCKECKKSQKPYVCADCGDNNKENFMEGRYNICKKCRSTRNAKQNRDRRRQVKYEKIEEIEVNKGEIPIKEVDLGIEKFLVTDRRVMNGYTIPEILQNFSAYNIHKSSEDDRRDEEIEYLKDEIAQIKYLMTEIMNLGKFIH
jgi:DNA-directed RNA polymerase subunit RPC12/RpoP